MVSCLFFVVVVIFSKFMAQNNSETLSKCIEKLPKLTEKLIQQYFDHQTTSARHFIRSELFLNEHYVKDVETELLPCGKQIRVRARCNRSFRKNETPHNVELLFTTSVLCTSWRNTIVAVICSCTVGSPWYCNHAVATLKLLHIYQKEGFSEVPPEISCTSKPQQWGRSRTRNEFTFRLTDESHGEYGVFQTCKKPRIDMEHNKAVHELSQSFQRKNRQIAGLLKSGASIASSSGELTRLSEVPGQSILVFQLSTNESEYDVATNVKQTVSIRQSKVLERTWDGFLMDAPKGNTHLPKNTFDAGFLRKLQIDVSRSKFVEKNSRAQSKSAMWKKERAYRVTASTFGQIVKRVSPWTLNGIQNVLECEDISGLRQTTHVYNFESVATTRYQNAMHRLGRQITTHLCGLVIDPKRYWLAGSPDRRVFDHTENPPDGHAEMKCPHSLSNQTSKECLSNACFYAQLVDGTPRLDRSHEYYCQVIGQMALTGLKWCDFVVFTYNGLIIERIRFDPVKWNELSEKLNFFYFSHALPFYSKSNVMMPSSIQNT